MMVGDFHLPGSDFQPKKRMGVGRVSSFKTPGIDKVGFEDSSKLVTTLRSFVGLYGKLCGLLACDCSYKFPFRFIGLVCFFSMQASPMFFFPGKLQYAQSSQKYRRTVNAATSHNLSTTDGLFHWNESEVMWACHFGQ